MDNDPRNDSHEVFKLSDEYISQFLHHVAETLVVNGVVEINEDGVIYKKDDERMPYRFSYNIPLDIAKELFFGNDDLVLSEARITYSSEYRIDEPRYDAQLRSTVHMLFGGVMPGTDIEVDYLYSIGGVEGGTKRADIFHEYSRDGKVINRKAGLNMDNSVDQEVLLGEMMHDTRAMTLDDVEKIRTLMEYVSDHPQREQ